MVAVFTGADMAADNVGGLPCGWQIHNKDGSPMAEPPHPVLAVGKVRHVGDPIAVVIAETKQAAKDAAELLDIDYDDLPAVATLQRRAAPGRGPGARRRRRATSATTGMIGDKAVVDGAFAKARKMVKLDLTNNRLIPNAMEPRAAIGDFDPIIRRLHAVHHQPEPARHPPADGRLRAAHPGKQAARRRARRRRRLRLQDLPLRRGSDRHLGRRQAAPAGEMDRRAQRKLHVATRTAATMSATAEMALDADGNFLALRVATLANMGAYLSTFAPCIPDLSLRDVARRRLQDPGDLLRGEGGVHQHRPGGRLSRRRPARRRRSCWSGWST